MDGKSTAQTAYGFSLAHEPATLLNGLRPYWPSLYLGALLLLVTNLVTAYLPVLINAGVLIIDKGQAFSIDLYFFQAEMEFFPLLAAIVALAIIGAGLRTYSRRVLFDVGRTLERDVRGKLFSHLSTLDDEFYQKHTIGDLMTHLSSDVSNIRMVAGFAALNIINIVFVFMFTVPLLLRIDIVLGICALIPFPLIVFATRGITKKMFQATMSYQAEQSKLIGHVQENLLGAHVVRLFHQQDYENERFQKSNQQLYEAGIKLARVRVLLQPIMRLMVGLAVGLVLYVGGLAVMSGRITVGDFVEVNARILQLSWPAMSVGFVLSVLSRGQASFARINTLLKYTPDIVDGPQIHMAMQTIKVQGLKLNRESDHTVEFSLRRGQLLGVVGPSGSFKSTLLRALLRRKIVSDKNIFFDDVDINKFSLNSIYQNVAVVPEESFLFHKSIRENICFARPEASTQEIDDVLELTRLDRDIKTFAEGLDTVVGDRGITLSGGQRQRVALARALLAKRPLLILDDALSSVDAETERHIVSRMGTYMRDAIVIIATHRLSAIKNADQIVVLDQGQVVAAGTHHDLQKTNPLYQSLWGLEALQGQWT